jgi:glycosyltransferase involved in cell wall biosynthesis
MRIAYVMQDGGPDVRQRPLSGPANHVWQVFNELKNLGHDIRFLARYQGRLWSSHDLESFHPVVVPRYDGGPIRALERGVRGVQSRLQLPYLNLFESLRFATACVQQFTGCDILYERMGWFGYGAGLAARRTGIPLVLEVNNGDLTTELDRLGVAPKGIQRRLAIELMRRAVFRASHYVASGHGHRQRFIEFWGVEPERVTTVENGSELVHLLMRDQLRAFGPAEDHKSRVTIVYVGAFEPWHGVTVLLDAMPHIIASAPGVRLKLLGSGTLRSEIAQQITAMGLESHVEMMGQVDIHQVAERLKHADIGVAPYCGWMEYSGLKLFDYKAAALGIVASGENGHPATLCHEQTAIIVPPCNEGALAAAILRLIIDVELRRKLGREARLEAERVHSWRHTAEQLERVFLEVLQESAAGVRTDLVARPGLPPS